MALTAEQLAQIEFDKAVQATHRKMDLVRLAKEVLVENDRSKPAEERGVSAADITAFATELNAYVNQ